MKVFACIVTVFLVSGAASAQYTTVSPPPASGATAPPPYTVVRYDENYSYLKDPANRTDFFDPVKYIPFGSAGDDYLTLGGQVRDRYEYFNHNTFGVGPQDPNGYNLVRVMENADLHLGPNIRFFAQGISAFEEDRDGGPRANIDVDQINLEQAFVDVKLPIGDQASFTIRGGRQELLFGAQRLIGPLDWTNTQRTFEGIRGTLSSPNNDLDLFLVRPIAVQKYAFNNEDNHQAFAGIYDTLRLPTLMPGAHSKLEAYGLLLKRTAVAYPTEMGPGHEDRYTVGGRFTSNPKPFDIDVEADYQLGDFKGAPINAYSLATEDGFTLAGVPLTPRPFMGFDIASGDNHPGNRELGTFNQLFPTAHSFFGYIDAIGRQNIIDMHPGVEFTVLEGEKYAQKVKLRAEYHEFWRQSDRDAVYNAAGAVLRPGATTSARNIGGELDLLLNWQIDRHLSTYFGYSHFFSGTFIRETGPSDDIDFVYGAVQFTF